MAAYWYSSILLYFSMNGLVSILLERILRQFGYVPPGYLISSYGRLFRRARDGFVVGFVGMVSCLITFKKAGWTLGVASLS